MLDPLREQSIISALSRSGRVSVAVLARDLGVSHETIRRDLSLLEGFGRLRRIHGGAVLHRPDQEQPIVVRSRVKAREKARIAAAARERVKDGMSIFIDTGSTPMAFARTLQDARDLTVHTNSLDIAIILGQAPGIRVKTTPGWVRPNDNALIGGDTLSFVRRFVYDVAFMGIAACDSEFGWMDYADEESELRRVLYQQASSSVLLVDDSKFGRRAWIRTFDITTKLTVVTNRALAPAFARIFMDAGVDFLPRLAPVHTKPRDTNGPPLPDNRAF
jgi:DeoR family transcriptional regulator, glycerol-3-phosphate regulon repressor